MSKKTVDNRPTWDQYFMLIVDAVSSRATCNRGESGAVITKDNRIIATGYVGAPSLVKDCYNSGHLFEERIYKEGEIKKHCIRTIHAEQNAIAQSAKYGIKLSGSTIYCTLEPCFNCAKLIVACGIKRVVAKYKYHAASYSYDLFKDSQVTLEVLNNQILSYQDE